MAWNPFKAIGDAIGRVLGREEPSPAPQPERAREPQERGFFGKLVDRVTGAERSERVQERSERERQLEERERQLVEREKQVEERERAVSAPPTSATPISAPTGGPPTSEPAPDRELPKFGSGPADYIERDERAFGTDSDVARDMQEAVDNFIMDRGGLDDLSVDAREWLENPTISEPFSEYWVSGGFTADQVLAGMISISNIEIKEGEDGKIHVEFDYVSEIDRDDLDGEDGDGDYVVSGHAGS